MIGLLGWRAIDCGLQSPTGLRWSRQSRRCRLRHRGADPSPLGGGRRAEARPHQVHQCLHRRS
jgi:hypothetical protein